MFDGIGIEERITEAGIRVVRLHYTADERKRGTQWQRSAREGYTSKRDWQREMEIDWSIASGIGIYTEDWERDRHVANLAFEPGEKQGIVLGFDFGLQPACAWLYVTAMGCIRVFRETVTWDGRSEPKAQGIDRLLDQFQAVYGAWHAANPLQRAYYDPAGDSRQQTDERTCVEFIRHRLGIPCTAGPLTPEARRGAMRAALGKSIGGVPFLQISPSCTMLIEGLAGAYRYKQTGDGATSILSKDADKNAWSHVVEALEYAIGGLMGRVDSRQVRNARKVRRPVGQTGY